MSLCVLCHNRWCYSKSIMLDTQFTKPFAQLRTVMPDSLTPESPKKASISLPRIEV